MMLFALLPFTVTMPSFGLRNVTPARASCQPPRPPSLGTEGAWLGTPRSSEMARQVYCCVLVALR